MTLGIGDDAAAWDLSGPSCVLIANDAVLEGRHAESGPLIGPQLARKVVRSNVSDLAAMGGEPELFFLSLKLGLGASLADAQAIIETIESECERYGCVLAGGDTVVGDGGLWLSGTLVGRAWSRPCSRSGAQVGDLVVVSGALGGSILGRHLDFEPRIELAEELMRWGPPTAMADISDGLSRDLLNILEASDVGAKLDAASIPIHADAKLLSRQSGRTPLEHALHDGEDFELVFTMSEETWLRLQKDGNSTGALSVIGLVTDERGDLRLSMEVGGEVQPLVAGGFDHGG
ncbi:MAG: thiamine-phosphate kinase [Planctomycetota bacterium]